MKSVQVVAVQAIAAQLRVVVETDADKLPAEIGKTDPKRGVRVWANTMPKDLPIREWPAAKKVGSRARFDPDTGERGHVDRFEITLPLAHPGGNLEVAAGAAGSKGEVYAQTYDENFRPGYRLYADRQEDGRFREVDGGKLVKDVASLANCKEIVSQFGDATVAELRARFQDDAKQDVSVTQILKRVRNQPLATRASYVALVMGGQLKDNAAAIGAQLATGAV